MKWTIDISVSQIRMRSGESTMSRYNFPIPYGWFYVAQTNAVAPGALQPVRRFGRDLVLWRGEDGTAHLQDAYCPHLGANIGVGGAVVGNTLQCPFHKWQFNGDGSVAAIPYAKQLNKKACLGTYPVREHYGNIMAWYHPHGAAPSFDMLAVPELDSGEYVGPLVQAHTIKTCIQEMAENTVDGAHFQTIHAHPGEAHYESCVFDGPLMSMHTTQMFPSSRGPVPGTLSSESAGYGFGVVRYKTLADICMITVNAPIETELSEQVFQVYYRNPQRDEKIDRIGHAFSKEVNRQLMQDVPIWENKIYQEKPNLCDGDGPIFKFRQWAAQFYAS
jgi:phenylpropionate dioxygenase-like ring-hydroxylating dioxygenase large terminal subunit